MALVAAVAMRKTVNSTVPNDTLMPAEPWVIAAFSCWLYEPENLPCQFSGSTHQQNDSKYGPQPVPVMKKPWKLVGVTRGANDSVCVVASQSCRTAGPQFSKTDSTRRTHTHTWPEEISKSARPDIWRE